MRFALLAAVLLTSIVAWGRSNDIPAAASRTTTPVATAPEGRAHAWAGHLTSIDGGGLDGTVASAWEADGLLAEAFDDGQGAPSPDVVRTHLRGAGMVLGVDGAAFGLDHLGSPVLRWDGADATIQRFDAWGAHRGGTTPALEAESVSYTGHALDGESKLHSHLDIMPTGPQTRDRFLQRTVDQYECGLNGQTCEVDHP
jgi:hypothetical protein